MIAFFGYVGMGDPHTKFLVYSRGAPPGWIEEQQRAFVAEAERRYPHLKGRVFTFQVPRNAAGESSFRDPTTGEAIRCATASSLKKSLFLSIGSTRVAPQILADSGPGTKERFYPMKTGS